MAKREYIEKLQNVILQRHACEAAWLKSMPVRDVFRDQIIWDGCVELFSLSGHPKAKTAYAWVDQEGKHGVGEKIETVLEIPPVDSPLTAIWASNIAVWMNGM